MNQVTRHLPVHAALMRAARLTSAGRISIEQLPLPEPGKGQVRIRLEGCGVSPSNLGPWAGSGWTDLPTDPGALGCEGWGRIHAAGTGVTGLHEGQRVAFLGRKGYATHEVVDADAVLPLPDSLAGPFPGAAFACAMNVLRRSRVRPGDQVAIIGTDFMGLVLARLAAAAGARVITLSRQASALVTARQLGAAQAVVMGDHHPTLWDVGRLTNDRFCDVVIETAGQQRSLDLASGIVAEGGRLVIAGDHGDGLRQVDMRNWNRRGIDVINAHQNHPGTCLQGMREALAAIQAGRLDPDPFLTHAFPLDRLDEALDATRDRPEGFIKAYVTCS